VALGLRQWPHTRAVCMAACPALLPPATPLPPRYTTPTTQTNASPAPQPHRTAYLHGEQRTACNHSPLCLPGSRQCFLPHRAALPTAMHFVTPARTLSNACRYLTNTLFDSTIFFILYCIPTDGYHTSWRRRVKRKRTTKPLPLHLYQHRHNQFYQIPACCPP